MKDHLWFRVSVPFLLFVVAGTLGLLLLLNDGYRQKSTTEFMTLATANAEFLRDAHIPLTDRFASYLRRVLGVDVYFGRVPAPDARHEAVTVAIEPGTELTLIRPKPSLRELLLRPASLVAFSAFWILSLALAWAVVIPYLQSQRLVLLGRMATALAHEIQNPVAAIQLHAQLAGHAAIAGEAATIESLVNQWMFLAKPSPPHQSAVRLDQLLADVVNALTPQAGHANVRIELDVAAAGTVNADARRLGQVFRNLIRNAIEALPSGGTLTITARDRQITFADTGPGFSPTALARCPALFYTEKEGGMGIGLAVSREIIQAHGGQLTIANQPGGGALVTVTL